MLRIFFGSFVVLLIASCGVAQEQTREIETGENYISNGQIRVEVLSSSKSIINYSVWNEEGKTWDILFDGKIGYGGLGSKEPFDLLAHEQAEDMKIEEAEDTATMTFKVVDRTKDGTGQGGDGGFYQVYRITIWRGKNRAHVELESEAETGKGRMGWVYRIKPPWARYLISAHHVSGGKSVVESKDIFEQKINARQVGTGKQWVGAYNPEDGYVHIIYYPKRGWIVSWGTKNGVWSFSHVNDSHSLWGINIGKGKGVGFAGKAASKNLASDFSILKPEQVYDISFDAEDYDECIGFSKIESPEYSGGAAMKVEGPKDQTSTAVLRYDLRKHGITPDSTWKLYIRALAGPKTESVAGIGYEPLPFNAVHNINTSNTGVCYWRFVSDNPGLRWSEFFDCKIYKEHTNLIIKPVLPAYSLEGHEPLSWHHLVIDKLAFDKVIDDEEVDKWRIKDHLTPRELSGFDTSQAEVIWKEIEDFEKKPEGIRPKSCALASNNYVVSGTWARRAHPEGTNIFEVRKSGYYYLWIRHTRPGKRNIKIQNLTTNELLFNGQAVFEKTPFARYPVDLIERFGWTWTKIWAGKLVSGKYAFIMSYTGGFPIADCFVLLNDSDFIPVEARNPGEKIAIVLGNVQKEQQADELTEGLAQYKEKIEIVEQKEFINLIKTPFAYGMIITLGVDMSDMGIERDWLRLWVARGGKLVIAGVRDARKAALPGKLFIQYEIDIASIEKKGETVMGDADIPLCRSLPLIPSTSGTGLLAKHPIWHTLIRTTEGTPLVIGRPELWGSLYVTSALGKEVASLADAIYKAENPFKGAFLHIGADVFPEYRIATLGRFDNSWKEFSSDDGVPDREQLAPDAPYTFTFDMPAQLVPARLVNNTIAVRFEGKTEPLILRMNVIWKRGFICGMRVRLNDTLIYRRMMPNPRPTAEGGARGTRFNLELRLVLPKMLLQENNILQLAGEGPDPLYIDALQLEKYREGNLLGFSVGGPRGTHDENLYKKTNTVHRLYTTANYFTPFNPYKKLYPQTEDWREWNRFWTQPDRPNVRTLIAILETLHSAPAWFNSKGVAGDGYSAVWDAFIHKIAEESKRTKSEMTLMVAGHNEFNAHEVPMDAIVERQRAIYEIFKEVNPEATVLSPCCPNPGYSATARVGDLGVFDYCDGATVHLYHWAEHYDVEASYLFGLGVQFGKHLSPMIADECGGSSESRNPAGAEAFFADEYRKAFGRFLMTEVDALIAFIGFFNLETGQPTQAFYVAKDYEHVLGGNQYRCYTLVTGEIGKREAVFYGAAKNDKDEIRMIILAETSAPRELDIYIPCDWAKSFDVIFQASEKKEIIDSVSVVDNTIHYTVNLAGFCKLTFKPKAVPE